MKKYSDSVTTTSGSSLTVLSSATVTVYLTGTVTLASIYSTNAGAAKANPFTSSSTGLIEFYAADGRYDIKVEKAGYNTVTVADVLMEDPDDSVDDDVDGIAITNSTIEGTSIGYADPDVGTFSGLRVSTVSVAAPTVGQFRWNDTDGTAELRLKGGNVDLQIGQEQVTHVYNNTGSTFVPMQVIRITGSQGSRLTAALAQADSEIGSSKTFGVIAETIPHNQYGFATTSGLISDVDTSSYAEGAALWLSPTGAGGMTTTKPQAPNHQVLVGWCVRSHASLGVIYVHVHNGSELDELHDVKITGVANGDILRYNSGLNVWENIANGGITFTTSSTGSAILPVGTTAQRDVTPSSGYLRYNTTLAQFEGYTGTVWGGVGGAQAGGVLYENSTTITSDYTITTGKNAMTVGPLAINTGAALTIPSGQRLVIL